jgi:predicted RNA-binding Zn-ribbon protein involved in translation (DUF1610 family)
LVVFDKDVVHLDKSVRREASTSKEFALNQEESMNKCPKCEHSIARFAMAQVKAQKPGASTLWNCLSYNCPHCGTVISVEMDPTIIRDEILDDIKALLRRHQ